MPHPKDKLPIDIGQYRYQVPKNCDEPLKANGRPGWMDEKGNRWEWHRSNVADGVICEHWDVQHPNGKHSNITPQGERHHRRVHDEMFP